MYQNQFGLGIRLRGLWKPHIGFAYTEMLFSRPVVQPIYPPAKAGKSARFLFPTFAGNAGSIGDDDPKRTGNDGGFKGRLCLFKRHRMVDQRLAVDNAAAQ